MEQVDQAKSPVRILAAVSLAALLLLRFPLLIYSGVTGMYMELAFTAFVIGTYLFTAIYIGAQREILDRLHVTRGFLLLFLLLPVLALVLRYTANGYYIVSWMMPAAWLLMFLLPARGRPRFLHISPLKSLIWFLLSVLLGVGTGIAFGLLTQSGTEAAPLTVGLAASSLLFQLTTAALCEEPLFRGFLWAWLRERGINLWLVCLIQAALFALAHMYYLFDGRYLSFVGAFFVGFLLGLVAWKSKSLCYPVLVHALINTTAELARYIAG